MAKRFAYMPVVDMEPLTAGRGGGRELVAAQLRAALQDFETCYVINHGVPLSLIQRLQRECMHYFRLPSEEKRKHGADVLPQEIQKHGGVQLLKEGFHWFQHPGSNGREETSACSRESLMYYAWPPALRNEDLWPDSIRQELSIFSSALHDLNRLFLVLLAESLGIPPTSFHDGVENAEVQLMAIHYYPPLDEHRANGDGTKFGLGPHMDTTLLTTLLCSDVPGLQVVENGEWLDVEPMAGAFVVQPGVLLQVLSNEIFKAKLHRVTSPSLPRCSIVSGVRISPMATVKPLLHLVGSKTPALYTPVNVEEYMHISRGAGLVTTGDHLDSFRVPQEVV